MKSFLLKLVRLYNELTVLKGGPILLGGHWRLKEKRQLRTTYFEIKCYTCLKYTTS